MTTSQVVHFEDFERAVYPFLRQKIIDSQKISEAVMHNTFKVSNHHNEVFNGSYQ